MPITTVEGGRAGSRPVGQSRSYPPSPLFGAGFAKTLPHMTIAANGFPRGTFPRAWGSPLMGQKLLHYDVIERLGEGARSVIYAVSDPNTKQLYAMKHVVRADPKDLRFVGEMEAGFEISPQCPHPNLRRT